MISRGSQEKEEKEEHRQIRYRKSQDREHGKRYHRKVKKSQQRAITEPRAKLKAWKGNLYQ